MTTVGVQLKVTDTFTGETRNYTNPLGTLFLPIQDTRGILVLPDPDAYGNANTDVHSDLTAHANSNANPADAGCPSDCSQREPPRRLHLVLVLVVH